MLKFKNNYMENKIKRKLLAILLIAFIWIGAISTLVILRLLFGYGEFTNVLMSIFVVCPPLMIISKIIWKHFKTI